MGNEGKCWSVKKKGSTARCPKSARPGQDYCGIHLKAKSVVRWAPSGGSESAKENGEPPKKAPVCVNEEDLYTCNPLAEVPLTDLFILEEGGLKYGFEVPTFQAILDNPPVQNPYTKGEIPASEIDRFKGMLGGKKIVHKEPKLTKKQRLNDAVLRVFQKIDMLDNYTNPDWFLALNKSQLRTYYLLMKDIWEYRAGLTPDQRLRIVSDGKAFTHTLSQLKVLRPMDLQYLLLFEMERLISEGIDIDERKLGAIYLLAGLTYISPQAYEALPQYHGVF